MERRRKKKRIKNKISKVFGVNFSETIEWLKGNLISSEHVGKVLALLYIFIQYINQINYCQQMEQ